jgi:RyR and IP3R Homology associated
VRICLEMICSYSRFDTERNYGCRKLYGAIMTLFTNLLEKGNVKVQDRFYEYFSQNPQSEKFFAIINSQIESQIKKRVNGKADETIGDECLNKLEFAYRPKDKFFGTKNLLKILQLLCEGHHTNLQIYLRFQQRSQKNYNMLEIIVYFLDKHLRSQHKTSSESKFFEISLVQLE